MNSERLEEETGRIVHCINCCWPEYPFSNIDIRKPTGEKFRDVLGKFLKGFLGCNHSLANINMNEISKNPEMFGHMESNLNLFREIRCILNSLGYTSLHYGDLLKPTPSTVRDVLLTLVNFLAYFEAEESNKEEIEAEMQALKHQALQNEKKLEEEERRLDKGRQSLEEKKIMGAEMRQLVVHRKEKCLAADAAVGKLEVEVELITKRMRSTNAKIEQAANTLKQVELEKEKAAEAVVPDPEALEAELSKSQQNKEIMEADFSRLKNRLPVLEQQIQDRNLQLQEHKETHQRLDQVKTRESKTKLEWQRTEADYRRVDEEKQMLDGQLKTNMSLIDSKKRMLEEYNQKGEQLRSQLEKARSDVKQCMSEEDIRRSQLQARIVAMDNEVARLTQDLKLGQKALDEGAAVLEAIHLKHLRDLEAFRAKYHERFQAYCYVVDNGIFRTARKDQ